MDELDFNNILNREHCVSKMKKALIDFPEIEEADIQLNELLPAIDDWQTLGY